MARFVDIDDERFWDILFDEACVEGSQAERIEKELEKIVSFDMDSVVEQLAWCEDCEEDCHNYEGRYAFERAIEIVKDGGVNG